MLGDSRKRILATRAGLPLVCALLGILASDPARAQEGPTFSIDFQGASPGFADFCGGIPITEGDILSVPLPGPPGPNLPSPGPLPPPCVQVGALPGAPGVLAGGLGIVPGLGGFVELDALSYGVDRGTQLVFSVDEFASGVAGPLSPDVFTQGSTGVMEASADVFAFRGPLVPTPPGPSLGNTIALDGDGLAPPGTPPVALGLGLIEPNPPTAIIPDVGDNLDALDVNTEAVDLTGVIYFSLDSAFAELLEGPPANTGTAAGSAFSGADVLGSFVGGAPFVAIPALALGLDLAGFDSDDIDALVFFDADASGTLTPPDTIYFSVRRGSAVIGALDSAFGVPIEEGDILTVPAGAGLPPAIFIAAEALGLGTLRSGTVGPFGFADDVDAIDLRLNPTFSVDLQGPSAGVPVFDFFFVVPISEGDILTAGLPGLVGPNPAALGPLPAPGTEIGAAPGTIGAVPGGLGILPGLGGFVELDALSYGRDRGTRVLFSVDEFAIGAAGPFPPDVVSEGAAGAMEASADVFEYLGQVIPTTPAVVKGNTVAFDGDGIFPSGAPGVGLIDFNPPTPGVLPDPGDNLDAFDADTVFGDLAAGPIYFSLDSFFPDPLEPAPANSGTAPGMGFSGGDVLVSFAGGAPVGAIPAPFLGLDLFGFDSDDLDALIFDDADFSGSFTPGDLLLFSVRRGSAVIGAPDGLLGIPIEEGDVLSPPPLGPGFPPDIFIPAESLGLATVRAGTAAVFGDDLDALDAIPMPEPGLGLQLGVGLAFLFVMGRRRARP